MLLAFDVDLASDARSARCACGGALHRADYPRKPRGGPADLDPAYATRFSFCCARDDCRRRTTPPSVRFLGRRVYLAAVVVLVAAMRHGVTPPRVAQLTAWFGVTARTLARWRLWWTETFVRSPVWIALRGRLMPPIDEARLPTSWWERIDASTEAARVLRLLVFLLPFSARNAVGVAV